MLSRAFWTERRVTGLILIMQTVFFIGAASLLSKENIPEFTVWKSRWASAGMITTAAGLVLLEAILREAGDCYFSRLGMVCYLFAAVAWLIGIGIPTFEPST